MQIRQCIQFCRGFNFPREADEKNGLQISAPPRKLHKRQGILPNKVKEKRLPLRIAKANERPCNQV
jgi:hypothetical protein